MAVLETTYENIRSLNNVTCPSVLRKNIKQLLKDNIMDIEFHRPKQRNQPEVVSAKVSRDSFMTTAAQNDGDSIEMDMKCLYDAAHILRKTISSAERWEFNGSLEVNERIVPRELYSFFRWLICGRVEVLSSTRKQAGVNRSAMSISQTAISMSYSERQIKQKTTANLHCTRIMPQQVAIGLSIHQTVRNKKIIEILHGYGMSIEYNRLFRYETQIDETITQDIASNQGINVPKDNVKGRYVFFATNNVDFQEDKRDGKNTTHATALAVYQRKLPDDTTPPLILTEVSGSRALVDIPESLTSLKDCTMPAKPMTKCPTYPDFVPTDGKVDHNDMKKWLIAKTMRRNLYTDESVRRSRAAESDMTVT